MKVIKIENCGECPYCDYGFCTRAKRYVNLDIVNPDCPLESGECEWTKVGIHWNTSCGGWSEEKTGSYCPCCGKKIKEAGDE